MSSALGPDDLSLFDDLIRQTDNGPEPGVADPPQTAALIPDQRSAGADGR